MKQRNKILFACGFGILLAILLSLSAGATGYEPDGTSSEEYLFPAADCNRTIYVNCVDKDTGEVVKSVTYHTKRDVDELISSTSTLVDQNTQGMEEALSHFNEINFDDLNKAISDLSDVVEPLANFSNAFR